MFRHTNVGGSALKNTLDAVRNAAKALSDIMAHQKHHPQPKSAVLRDKTPGSFGATP